jgi:hypothetical protein
MWLDAFLSAALVVVCVIASPVIAALGLPSAARSAIAVAAVACAILLATLGAITAVALAVRMRAGQYQLPRRLRLPLPEAMRPPTG